MNRLLSHMLSRCAGGCGPECFVYLKGECGEPQEMLPGLDADGLKLHAELYGPNAKVSGSGTASAGLPG